MAADPTPPRLREIQQKLEKSYTIGEHPFFVADVRWLVDEMARRDGYALEWMEAADRLLVERDAARLAQQEAEQRCKLAVRLLDPFNINDDIIETAKQAMEMLAIKAPEAASRRIRSLEQQLEAAESRLTEARQEVAAETERADKLYEACNALTRHLEATRAKLAEAEQQRDFEKNMNAATQETLRNYEANISNLSQQLAAADARAEEALARNVKVLAMINEWLGNSDGLMIEDVIKWRDALAGVVGG